MSENKYNPMYRSQEIQGRQVKSSENPNNFDQNFANNLMSPNESKNIPKNLTVFPSELNSPEFQFRKLTIFVCEDNSYLEDFRGFVDQLKKDPFGTLNSSAAAIGESARGAIKEPSSLIKAKRDYPISESKGCYVLPLPNNLTEVLSHNYAVSDGLLAEMINGLPGAENIQKKGSQLAHLQGKQKLMVNPDKFQDYQGSEPRRFDFTFKIIPSSLEEAINGAKIVYNLKKFASPSLGAEDLLMTQGNFFVLEFGNPVLQKLINPQACVLVSISSTYDDGTYVSTTLDGMPKSITLSLSFAETRTVTREDWGTSNE